MTWIWFHRLASPPHAYLQARRFRPWLLWSAVAMMIWAAYQGLFVAPADYQQQDAYRILFAHVPAAILSTVVYTIMAAAATVGFIWRMKIAHAVAVASAPAGAVFTVLALATGSIWGRPMWEPGGHGIPG